ncbi:hypothetical protein M0R45_025253 [Rubus argutus]|uniref:Uncharacterized protein n=1 Tax=Rubus argutus TaxID=59490 RepID=A0AAW1WTJ4_RUBAR
MDEEGLEEWDAEFLDQVIQVQERVISDSQKPLNHQQQESRRLLTPIRSPTRLRATSPRGPMPFPLPRHCLRVFGAPNLKLGA